MARYSRVVFVFILILVSMNLFASPFYSVQKNDIAAGKLQYALVKEKKNWILSKNTNLFDGRKNLGRFAVKKNKVISKELDELVRLEESLTTIEKRLGKFVPRKNKFLHQRFYQLGKYTIYPGDKFFKKLTVVFERIMKQIQIEIIEGAQLNITSKEVELKTYKDSKLIKTRNLAIREFCSPASPEKVCINESFGTLFL